MNDTRIMNGILFNNKLRINHSTRDEITSLSKLNSQHMETVGIRQLVQHFVKKWNHAKTTDFLACLIG